MKAIVIRENGGAEVLNYEDVAVPKNPGPGQALIRHTAIGVNFIDTYFRSGVYKTAKFPFVPGIEACGIVERVGKGVDIEIGKRVVYATARNGAYSEKRLINARHLIGVPDSVSDEIAVAVFAKGLTAHYLLYRTYQLKKNDVILVHSAAGATGQIITQWAKYIGAKVIGTVGSEPKMNVAKKKGCDVVINYTQDDFVEKLYDATGGEGVNVVYDSVGKTTFHQSLKCLKNFGLMVAFGQSSGEVEDFNVSELSERGLFLTRPSLALYKNDRMELLLSAIEVYKMLEDKYLIPDISADFPLKDAAKAHKFLEERKTTGSVVLTV